MPPMAEWTAVLTILLRRPWTPRQRYFGIRPPIGRLSRALPFTCDGKAESYVFDRPCPMEQGRLADDALRFPAGAACWAVSPVTRHKVTRAQRHHHCAVRHDERSNALASAAFCSAGRLFQLNPTAARNRRAGALKINGADVCRNAEFPVQLGGCAGRADAVAGDG